MRYSVATTPLTPAWKVHSHRASFVHKRSTQFVLLLHSHETPEYCSPSTRCSSSSPKPLIEELNLTPVNVQLRLEPDYNSLNADPQKSMMHVQAIAIRPAAVLSTLIQIQHLKRPIPDSPWNSSLSIPIFIQRAMPSKIHRNLQHIYSMAKKALVLQLTAMINQLATPNDTIRKKKAVSDLRIVTPIFTHTAFSIETPVDPNMLE